MLTTCFAFIKVFWKRSGTSLPASFSAWFLKKIISLNLFFWFTDPPTIFSRNNENIFFFTQVLFLFHSPKLRYFLVFLKIQFTKNLCIFLTILIRSCVSSCLHCKDYTIIPSVILNERCSMHWHYVGVLFFLKIPSDIELKCKNSVNQKNKPMPPYILLTDQI